MQKRKPTRRRVNFDRVLVLFKQGMTAQDIASQVGCTKAYIYQLLHNAGLYRNSPETLEMQRKKAIRLFTDTPATVMDIATELQRHPSTIRSWLKEAGINLNHVEAHCKGLAEDGVLIEDKSPTDEIIEQGTKNLTDELDEVEW